MTAVDVLLPTCNRLASLTMTLCGLIGQNVRDYRLIVADQSDAAVARSPVVKTLRRMLELRGNEVEWHFRPNRRGIAEQRAFLLDRAASDYVLYLDDDVMMESYVLGRLLDVLRREGCGFVGAFPIGLSYLNDLRPDQQRVEFWCGPVQPEVVQPEAAEWGRYHLHRAANLYHSQRFWPAGEIHRYKVAWVASCVLYDRQKLLEIGGFSFWPRLPRYHSGEEVLVQNLLMRRFGGCAIAPSGTYHSEEPSTVLNRAGTVDGHALALLHEMTELLDRAGPSDVRDSV